MRRNEFGPIEGVDIRSWRTEADEKTEAAKKSKGERPMSKFRWKEEQDPRDNGQRVHLPPHALNAIVEQMRKAGASELDILKFTITVTS